MGRYEYFWSETLERWKSEGMPEDAQPEELLEETEEYVACRDSNGVAIKRIRGGEGHPPQSLDFRLKSARDWYEYKERLRSTAGRIPQETRADCEAARERGAFVVFNSNEAFIPAWNAVGQVGVPMMMADEPEDVRDMFDTYASLLISLAELMLRTGIDFDGAWLRGDMAYRSGPMFSPAMYDSLLLPAHRRLCDYFRSVGRPVMLHTDGKIDAMIPRFIDAGFCAIHPLEAKCDQDVRILKRIYGKRITLFGNIDARILAGSRQEIESETRSKLAVAAKGGGYIFHSDHSIPPSVSYENYLCAVELSERYGSYR